MILIDSTSSLLQLVTGGTQVVHVQANWVDLSGTTVTPATPPQNTSINSAATTTIVAGPAVSTSRNVKNLCITNTDASAATTVTVQHNDGTTVVTLKSCSLPAGYSLNYEDKEGWYVTDASGNRVIDNTSAAGLFIQTTLLTATGSSTFTTSARTNKLRIRMVGGGGQGGGNAATTGACGSGGGSGAYAEWVIAVAPSTGYTCQCGTGGTTGGTAAPGQAGASTTFTVGGTTCTAPGGSGGLEGTTAALNVIGGAGGALATNGTLNAAGAPGHSTSVAVAADNVSGAGGLSHFGGGAAAIAEPTNANGNSAAALGYGGGGGGSAGAASTARAGGAGAQGCIVVEEYTG